MEETIGPSGPLFNDGGLRFFSSPFPPPEGAERRAGKNSILKLTGIIGKRSGDHPKMGASLLVAN
ncbi:uncharacterized protein ZHAS_00013865 [Anopheles sinensis]|uniref:Uncharacterized protein n=1 Tax=Anopheles sinensis TaxID=74873 RepID=A0A084W6Q7_ANOSI|nr:uncharacterized protein ZHAS_00013865 [Anopheles sinensis]